MSDFATELLELKEKIENSPSPCHYFIPKDVMDQFFDQLLSLDREIKILRSENIELSMKAQSVRVQAAYNLSRGSYPGFASLSELQIENQIKERLKGELINACEREGLILFIREEKENFGLRPDMITFKASMRVRPDEAPLHPGQTIIAPEKRETK